MERVNQACAYLAKDFWPHLTHPPSFFFPPRQYTCHTLSLSLSLLFFLYNTLPRLSLYPYLATDIPHPAVRLTL